MIAKEGRGLYSCVRAIPIFTLPLPQEMFLAGYLRPSGWDGQRSQLKVHVDDLHRRHVLEFWDGLLTEPLDEFVPGQTEQFA